MNGTHLRNRIAHLFRTPNRRRSTAKARSLRPGLEGMESRLMLTAAPTYSDHINFDGLTFAIIGNPASGPKFQAGNVNGQAVESVTGAAVAVGKLVSDADFATRFAPLLYLNGNADGSNSAYQVTLDTATAATPTTTGNAHGEFTTDGDIEGYYAGGYQAIFGSGHLNTLYAGELTAPGGDSISNAGGVSLGFGGVKFTASNVGLDTVNNALTLQGSATINALSTTNTQAALTANASISTSGIQLNSLSGSIAMGTGQAVTVGPLQLSNGSLAVQYNRAKQEFDLAGSVTLTEAKPIRPAADPTLVVHLGALNTNNTIKTPGIAIIGGSLASLSGSVVSTSTFKAGGVTFSPQNLSVSYNAGQQSLAIDGAAKLAWGSGASAGSVAVQLGNAAKNIDGLVIENGSLQTLNGSISSNFSFLGLTYNVDQLTVGYQRTTNEITIAGGVSVTNDDPKGATFKNLSATLGNAASPGLVVRGGALQHLDLTVSGAFDLYGVELGADALHVVYDTTSGNLDLSGKVDVDLTSAIQGAVSLPDQGITINTRTGAFTLHNLELSFSANIGVFKLKELDVKYASTPSGYTVSGSAQVGLPGTSAVVSGSLVISNDQLQDIALSYDAGTGSGIPLGQTQIYLTHIGGELDNLNNASSLTVKVDAAISVGQTWTINNTRYSVLTASGSLVVTPNNLSLSGEVHVISAGSTDLLGSGVGSVNLDWQHGIYTASADLSMYGGVIQAHGDLTITNDGDLTLNAKASVQVPRSVPWIGGESVSANLYLQVRPDEDTSDTYAKAWVSTFFGTVGIEYNLKNGFDYFFGDPDIPSPTQQLGSTYTTSVTVTSGETDALVTISDPAFSNPNYDSMLSQARVQTLRPFFWVPAFPYSVPLTGYPSLPSNGDVSVDPTNGQIDVSLKELLGVTSLPVGTYNVSFQTPYALPQAPTFAVSGVYLPPSLTVGQPVLNTPSESVTIPLNARSFDPNVSQVNPTTQTTISLFEADSASAGTAANDDEGTLIATIPDTLINTLTVNGSRYSYVATSGTLNLPNGYVTYQNSTPVSFTWTTYPGSAQVPGAGTPYVYGLIDDGENVPVRSAQTVTMPQLVNPTPQVGAVAPVTTSFAQTLALPAPSVTDPGQWPMKITVSDNGGNSTLQSTTNGNAAAASTLSYQATGSNPAQQIAAFLSSLQYNPHMLPSNFAGHDSVTVDVTTLVGPNQVPFSAQQTIELSEPNADLVVSQTAARPILVTKPTNSTGILTITVTNQNVAGAETATNVVVTDTLPPGVSVQVVSGSPSLGTFDPTTGKWTVGTLAVGQTATLQLTMTPSSKGLPLNLQAWRNNIVVATSNQPSLYPGDAVNVGPLILQSGLPVIL